MGSIKTILIATKHQGVCRVASKIFGSEGYAVHPARTLRNALVEISSSSVDLIVCGIDLEDIPGILFLRYLKNDPLREAIPFVFLIHQRNQERFDVDAALSLGAEDCLFYPAAAKQIITKIKKILAEKQSQNKMQNGSSAQSSRSIVEISSINTAWVTGQIVNHTHHGTMIETAYEGKSGDTVKLKYLFPEGVVVAVGKLTHILLGDQERPVGIGVNFGRDENWRRINRFLKSEGKEGRTKLNGKSKVTAGSDTEYTNSESLEEEVAPVDLTQAPFWPVTIETPNDGNIWMPGKILRYSDRKVLVRTPLLGKSGNDIYMKCVLIQGQIIVKGQIEKITLDDLKMPAGIEVVITDVEKWHQAFDFLNELTDTLLSEENIQGGKSQCRYDKRNMETLVLAQKPAPKKDIKFQFYESLIGKQMGNYEIVALLGAGAMGGVFEGWDLALERSVALKIISYELSSKKEFVDMFFKEARYISQLNHFNISQVYYIGKENDILYYAMEYVQGENLAEMIKREVRIPAEKAIDYLLAACQGLNHVWGRKIIHRDIKPANIMVTEEGSVKIVDFGVAQQYHIGHDQCMENTAGSPPYLSPEAIQGQTIDHRSDIYSLGATFYHVLSGVPPFLGRTVQDILSQHLSVIPQRLKDRHTDIPAGVSDVIEKMLAKAPSDRFQTYQEIINAL